MTSRTPAPKKRSSSPAPSDRVSGPDWEPVGIRRQRFARQVALLVAFVMIAGAVIPALSGVLT